MIYELSEKEAQIIDKIRRERAKKKHTILIVRIPHAAPIQLFEAGIVKGG